MHGRVNNVPGVSSFSPIHVKATMDADIWPQKENETEHSRINTNGTSQLEEVDEAKTDSNKDGNRLHQRLRTESSANESKNRDPHASHSGKLFSKSRKTVESPHQSIKISINFS